MRLFTMLTLASLSVFPLHAAEMMCKHEPLKFLTDFVYEAQGLSEYPKMNFNYSLNTDCQYTVDSEIEIPNTASLKEFMGLYTSPEAKLASADRDTIIDSTETSDGVFSEQVLRVKKMGVGVSFISNCSLKEMPDVMVSECKLDVKKTKVAFIKIFEKNDTTITCRESSPGLKKCNIHILGKAKSMAIFGNACDMAKLGGASMIESIYRLSHYLTHGNVKNIKRGMDAVKDFENFEGHKNNGKETVVFKKEIE